MTVANYVKFGMLIGHELVYKFYVGYALFVGNYKMSRLLNFEAMFKIQVLIIYSLEE
jgi:hypothetical protein